MHRIQLKFQLPEHLRRHLREEVLELPLGKSAVDCGNCRLPVKCCDYWPFIPNFQLDRLGLEARVAGWLKRRQALTPLGLVAPPAFRRARNSGEPNYSPPGDGRCPFFTAFGQCEIWRHRPSECATYFCQPPEGPASRAVLAGTNDLLHELEQGLAQWWMLEAGYSWREIESILPLLTAEGGDWEFRAEEYAQMWAHHMGREREYFRKAAAWFDGLTRENVEKLLGPRWRARQNEIVNSAARAGRESLFPGESG